MLKADLENAEKLLLEALDLIPDSRNVNQKLGQFYYDNDQQEKGLELLSAFGMVMRVPRLDRPPPSSTVSWTTPNGRKWNR